eukprot:4503461-Prymnesium_polylepis.1
MISRLAEWKADAVRTHTVIYNARFGDNLRLTFDVWERSRIICMCMLHVHRSGGHESTESRGTTRSLDTRHDPSTREA